MAVWTNTTCRARRERVDMPEPRRKRRRWTRDDALAALAAVLLGVAALAGWYLMFNAMLEAEYGAAWSRSTGQ